MALRNVQAPISSTMPRPMAAAAVTGRSSIPPITAAARVRSRSAKPPPDTLLNDWNPRIGTRRMTASAERNPAMAQTIVERRRTGMPSNSARSEFSAAARIATVKYLSSRVGTWRLR